MATDEVFARAAELLWTGGLAATPLAVIVALVCRSKRVRPATRHMLWTAVLVSFLTPVISAMIWKPHWFRSDRLMAAADSMLESEAPERRIERAASAAFARSAPTNQEPVVAASTPLAPPMINLVIEPVNSTGRAAAAESAPVLVAGEQASEVIGPLPIESLVSNAAECARPPSCERDTSGYVNDRVSREALSPVRPYNHHRADGLSNDLTARRYQAPFEEVDRSAVSSPVFPVTKTSEPPRRSADGRGARAWIGRLLSVRDALAALPPVPTSLWFGGAVFVIMLSVWRRFAGMLWLRQSVPADPNVQAVVRQVGETLGLARIPRVVFVEAAISPMIWCGLRPLLVLPRPLWRTLDEDSRRAVLVHELAHVRRWDHLLCWLEAAVGALYWWHPVVWWARRRLQEEADASCDAWVTALFPSNRRAYASALLVTRSFVSSRAESRGPWLGVASGSTKRLARRITMVMTHKTAPRMSMVGACVTALVVATGALVMPGLACPPVEDETAPKAKQGIYVTRPAKIRSGQQAAPEQPGVTFFGEAPALEAMRAQPEAAPAHAPHPPAPPTPAHAPRAPRPPAQPGIPMVAPTAPVQIQPGMTAGTVLNLDALKEGRTPREYKLSEGKLEAFYGMMSRNDVPILVQMGDDHIVIWGTDDEHAVFSKFVRIVDGGGRQPFQGGVVAQGGRAPALAKLKAENGAMNAQGGLWTAQGADRAAVEQYRASVRDMGRQREAMERAVEKARADADEANERAEEFRELAQELRGRASGMSPEDRRELEQAARSLRSRSDALQSGSKSMEQVVKDLERQIRELEERAEKLEQERDNSGQNITPAKKRKAPMVPAMLAALSNPDRQVIGDRASEEKAACDTEESASR